jgi:flavin-binding protein dodecin
LKQGLQEAIEAGLAKASDTLENIEGARVQAIKLTYQNSKIDDWRVDRTMTSVLN